MGTRSSLHVDTIGLNSSTLDLELHALRSLVFNEIHGESVEEFTTDSVRTEAEVEMEELAELELKKSDREIQETHESTEECDPDNENVTEEDDNDLPRESRTRGERFHDIRKRFAGIASSFASTIWHERKRLRLMRSKEL